MCTYVMWRRMELVYYTRLVFVVYMVVVERGLRDRCGGILHTFRAFVRPKGHYQDDDVIPGFGDGGLCAGAMVETAPKAGHR